MFGWGRKQKVEDAAVQDPADIHPKSKHIPAKPTQPANQPATQAGSKESKAPFKKPESPIESGLNKDDIEIIRKAEFAELGIPYGEVLAAEKSGITRIIPQRIVRETQSINDKLKHMGFNFIIDCLECFTCQVAYLQYQTSRIKSLKEKRTQLPDHSLLDFIIMRRAEKVAREKRGLKENPMAGPTAASFQLEVIELFKRFCEGSRQFELRRDAIRRIQREKGIRNDQPLEETEIRMMIERIEREKAAGNQ